MIKSFSLMLALLIPCCLVAVSNEMRARAILTEGLGSYDFAVRIQAISAAGMIGSNDVMVARIEEFLKDKNVKVRLAAVRALVDLRAAQSKAGLQKVLIEDKAPEVSFAAAKALATLEDPNGTTVLMDVYDRKRKTHSNLIEQKKRSFFDEFHSPQSTLLFLISQGIGYVPVPGAGDGYSAISELLKDPELSDRAQVLFVLTRKKNDESFVLLGRALRDADWSVRAAATQIIAQKAWTEFRDSLISLFEDKNYRVRLRAAGAYLHLSLAETMGLADQ
jgi:HEAT repeat protein